MICVDHKSSIFGVWPYLTQREGLRLVPVNSYSRKLIVSTLEHSRVIQHFLGVPWLTVLKTLSVEGEERGQGYNGMIVQDNIFTPSHPHILTSMAAFFAKAPTGCTWSYKMMTPTITLRQKRAVSSFSNLDEYSLCVCVCVCVCGDRHIRVQWSQVRGERIDRGQQGLTD